MKRLAIILITIITLATEALAWELIVIGEYLYQSEDGYHMVAVQNEMFSAEQDNRTYSPDEIVIVTLTFDEDRIEKVTITK